MKVRVSFIVDADDDFRRALAQHYGKPGLATREDIKSHYEVTARADDMDIGYDFDEDRDVSTEGLPPGHAEKVAPR